MMLPAITLWPPDFLRPSLRPAESRPLRDDPPAFLCAMAWLPYFFFAGLAAGFRETVFAGLAAGLRAGFVSFLASAFFGSGFFTGAGFLSAFSALAGSGFVSAFFGSGFAAAIDGFLPSVRISVMRSAVSSWRWPF